jgi:hypothetical protein
MVSQDDERRKARRRLLIQRDAELEGGASVMNRRLAACKPHRWTLEGEPLSQSFLLIRKSRGELTPEGVSPDELTDGELEQLTLTYGESEPAHSGQE